MTVMFRNGMPGNYDVSKIAKTANTSSVVVLSKGITTLVVVPVVIVSTTTPVNILTPSTIGRSASMFILVW